MTLSIGTILSQVIPIAVSFILARLYTPDDYGDWGIFSSYTAILAVIVCGKYEYAILRPKRLIDAFHLCALSLIIGCCVSLLLYLFLGIAFCVDFSYIVKIRGVLWLPTYVMFLGVLQILSNYANREELYKKIAISSILRSCIQASSRIAMGTFNVRGGLIVGATLGLVGGCSYLVKQLSFQKIFYNISLKRLRELIIEYRKFPIFEAPSGLLNVLSANIPLLLLAYFFPKEFVGYFSMAMTILYVPMSFIGAALGQVFYKKACTWTDSNQVSVLALKIFQFTFYIGIIPVLFLILLGNTIFVFLLGVQWEMVGTFAMYMSTWIWLVLCFSPLSTIFLVKDKQQVGMFLNLIMLFSRIIVICIGGYLLKSISITILLYGTVGVILWFIEGMYIWRLTKINLSKKKALLMLCIFLGVFGIWCIKIISFFYIDCIKI
ncbi:lipopolysaccharide biosynthesis protein [Butyricimonas paravirosa]|uniref:lipopolysaccharide biosynthesis protein n=1 Tax=Butyricimonas paravirosa TaxID=1472417 RepID=UPI0022E88109|nr:oligosaccharide flippase family protein [Butyricimonas paravirosa]